MSHTALATDGLSARQTYRLLTSLVVPRPIAWVSTVGADGARNLAPFSYFQAVCSRPATVMLSLGWRSDGRPKDTLRNILDTGEFSISLVDPPLADAMHRTSNDLPPGTSEWDLAKVRPAPGRTVGAPHVADASAALECRLSHALPMGRGRGGGPSVTVVFGRVTCVLVRSDLVLTDEAGRPVGVDAAGIRPVGRLGGAAYTSTDDRFDLPRTPEEEGGGA